MTAGTRRNGTSKFGPFQRAAARIGGSDGQDGRDLVEVFGHDEYGDIRGDEYGDIRGDEWGNYAGDSSHGYAGDGSHGYEEPAIQAGHAGQAGEAGHAGDADQAGHEAEPSGNPRHYTGRHASPRGKTTRKRVGRVVPVAAVAATLAAGTAAYALTSGGQPHSSQLNAAMSSGSGSLTGAAGSGAGNANAAAARLIQIAKANASSAARAAAKPTAKASPSRKPTAAPSAAATHAAAATSAPAATKQAAAPAVAASAPATKAAATTLSCNLSYGMLPDNVTAIVSFLLANGYSDNAAAGIAGNMYQESKGDPESEGMGGGGLIGFTPLPAGYVTGNPATDLQTQLNAVLSYNQGWASYLPALNAAASPADAASIYVTDFERAGIPAASTREASADNVASACGI